MSAHSADRNLLFGIIALQLDFISRDQLIAAMSAWVLDKHKPLGEVLSEQGALSVEDREAIESLVRRHLLRHDNDPERSLAALSAIGERLRDDLSRIADPDVQASLPLVSASRHDTESTLTYLGSPTVPGGRFRILRPYAQGGLGVVSVALDEELHREVALKEIQERYAGETQPRLRFLLEAEITGGLEHPGIVPVYGLGHHPDGRPFYAMRFVRGESLKEAVARYHGEPGRVSAGSGSPGESSGEPGRVSAGSRSKARALTQPRSRFAASSRVSWMSATRSPMPTAAACSIVISSPVTSCLALLAKPWSSIGAWRKSSAATSRTPVIRSPNRLCAHLRPAARAKQCPARRWARRPT